VLLITRALRPRVRGLLGLARPRAAVGALPARRSVRFSGHAARLARLDFDDHRQHHGSPVGRLAQELLEFVVHPALYQPQIGDLPHLVTFESCITTPLAAFGQLLRIVRGRLSPEHDLGFPMMRPS